jgi:hypothetical protein
MAASVAAAANPPCVKWLLVPSERIAQAMAVRAHVTDRVSVVMPESIAERSGVSSENGSPGTTNAAPGRTAFVWRCSMTTTSYGSNALNPDRTRLLRCAAAGSVRDDSGTGVGRQADSGPRNTEAPRLDGGETGTRGPTVYSRVLKPLSSYRIIADARRLEVRSTRIRPSSERLPHDQEPPASRFRVSVEAMSWALSVPIGGNAKVILLGLANHAHPDGTEARPSIDRLKVYAQCDRRTVQRNLRQLEADGWIRTVKPGGQHRDQAATVYALSMGGILPPPTKTAKRGVTGDAPRAASAPPQPSLEPSLQSKSKPNARGRAREADPSRRSRDHRPGPSKEGKTTARGIVVEAPRRGGLKRIDPVELLGLTPR